jgi:hypothetical protein
VAATLLLAVLVDGARWTARSGAAARDRATADTSRAVRALAADGTTVELLDVSRSGAAGRALADGARADLAGELDTARTVLAGAASAPAAPRAELEAQISAATSLGASPSPASMVAATDRVRVARAALTAARAAAPTPSPAGPAVAMRPATTAPSCTSTYSGPPFYTSAPTADGDGSNGHLPASAMTALSWSVDDLGTPFYLRTDAAAALERLNTAFTAALGHPLDLDLTYRDYDTQVAMRAALGTVAAVPGTSAHGTGLAIDLPELPCSYGWDSPARAWLLRHGPAYGWVQPSWARQSGSNPEYWHYEYRG